MNGGNEGGSLGCGKWGKLHDTSFRLPLLKIIMFQIFTDSTLLHQNTLLECTWEIRSGDKHINIY